MENDNLIRKPKQLVTDTLCASHLSLVQKHMVSGSVVAVTEVIVHFRNPVWNLANCLYSYLRTMNRRETLDLTFGSLVVTHQNTHLVVGLQRPEGQVTDPSQHC